MIKYYCSVLSCLISISLSAAHISESDIKFVKRAMREQIAKNSTREGEKKYFARFVVVEQSMADKKDSNSKSDVLDEASNRDKSIAEKKDSNSNADIVDKTSKRTNDGSRNPVHELAKKLEFIIFGQGSQNNDERSLNWVIVLNKIYNPSLRDKSDKKSLARALFNETQTWKPFEKNGKVVGSTTNSPLWEIDEKHTKLRIRAVIFIINDDGECCTRMQRIQGNECLICICDKDSVEQIKIIDTSSL